MLFRDSLLSFERANTNCKLVPNIILIIFFCLDDEEIPIETRISKSIMKGQKDD